MLEKINKISFWDFLLLPFVQQFDVILYKYLELKGYFIPTSPKIEAIASPENKPEPPATTSQSITYLYQAEHILEILQGKMPLRERQITLTHIQTAYLWLQKGMIEIRAKEFQDDD